MSAAWPTSQAEMPFLEHLAELRTRIVRSAIAIIGMTIVCYNWAPQLFAIITAPLFSSFGKVSLIGTGPADAFLCELHVAIASGVILSAPFWFYQIWLFIQPGLKDEERRFAIPFIVASTVFFIGGVCFCFQVALPVAFQYFSGRFEAMHIGADIRISEYLSFVIKLAMIFGIVFELPIVSYFLARLNLLTDRWLLKNFRYAVLVIFVVAAVLTPPDVLSQLLLAGPLLVIYGICILVCKFVSKKKQP